MSTRRFNWTDRHRIPQERIVVRLRDEEGIAAFDAQIDLAGLNLDPAAGVCVEAYRETNWMRFDFGTVGFIRPSPLRRLEELTPADAVLFRVKVLGVGEARGRILAEAERIRPIRAEEQDSGRVPLLIPRGEDLGNRLWKLQLDESGPGPQLLVNSRAGDWREIARSPSFMWCVLPEVLRQVLATAIELYDSDDEASESWPARWVRYVGTVRGVGPMPAAGDPEGDQELWLDETVEAFCRQHQFFDRFLPLLGGRAEQ